MNDDLISRKALIAEYDRVHIGPPGGARKLMEDAPAVDAVPVVHGRRLKTQEPLSWTDVDCIECSNCHESWIIDEDCGFSDLADSWKYCPNCGADMTGGENNV